MANFIPPCEWCEPRKLFSQKGTPFYLFEIWIFIEIGIILCRFFVNFPLSYKPFGAGTFNQVSPDKAYQVCLMKQMFKGWNVHPKQA